jgi:hypothetical protein
MLNARSWQKWYARAIGAFFILVVVSLVADHLAHGLRTETWHKVFHVVLGVVVVSVGWSNPQFWRPFCLANGAFFALVGLVGWLFPGLGGLDAFNRMDTVLHSLVGIAGLGIGSLRPGRRR